MDLVGADWHALRDGRAGAPAAPPSPVGLFPHWAQQPINREVPQDAGPVACGSAPAARFKLKVILYLEFLPDDLRLRPAQRGGDHDRRRSPSIGIC